MIRRAQPDVGTRALRAAMTSAEFQRRDASRARGPKVSTGVLAQLRSARRRESRERNAAEGFAGRGAKGGEEEGRADDDDGSTKSYGGRVGSRAEGALATTPNPRRAIRTPIFVPQPLWKEAATPVTLPYISFYILFRTALPLLSYQPPSPSLRRSVSVRFFRCRSHGPRSIQRHHWRLPLLASSPARLPPFHRDAAVEFTRNLAAFKPLSFLSVTGD